MIVSKSDITPMLSASIGILEYYEIALTIHILALELPSLDTKITPHSINIFTTQIHISYHFTTYNMMIQKTLKEIMILKNNN